MDGIEFSDILMCILLISICISIIPILKYCVGKFIDMFHRVNKSFTNMTSPINTTGRFSYCKFGIVERYWNSGFLLSYFILIVLIVMIVLLIVLCSCLR